MKISKGTIVRTVLVITVIINLILKAFGINPINLAESTVASAVEAAVEIGTIACAWWYNNSFTDSARKADEFFKSLKESDKGVQNRT